MPYGWIKNKSMLAPVLIHSVIALSSDMAENVPHMCEMKLVVRLTSVAYKSHFKPKRLCRIKSCLLFQADIIHDVQQREEPHSARATFQSNTLHWEITTWFIRHQLIFWLLFLSPG